MQAALSSLPKGLASKGLASSARACAGKQKVTTARSAVMTTTESFFEFMIVGSVSETHTAIGVLVVAPKPSCTFFATVKHRQIAWEMSVVPAQAGTQFLQCHF
jgi:hypothetical protein